MLNPFLPVIRAMYWPARLAYRAILDAAIADENARRAAIIERNMEDVQAAIEEEREREPLAIEAPKRGGKGGAK